MNSKKKIISVKADGNLNISVENHLFKKIRNAHTWYTSKFASIPAVFVFLVIDICGFGQIMRLTIKDSELNRVIIIAALAVAFEFAPLYIGYALCLKSYGLGKPIHNWVLGFSTAACILGVFGNTYFRYNTMDIAYSGKDAYLAMPMTVLMSLLPVITSLVNLTLGCLGFDPLLFDLARVSKKLQRLKIRHQQMKAFLEEFKDEEKIKEEIMKDEEACYESVKNDIYALRNKLNTYVITRTSLE